MWGGADINTTNTATRRDALGTLGECVMSIYGIARSLECRELGPAQLLPAIDDFRARSVQCCADAHGFIAEVEERSRTLTLNEPVRELIAEINRVMNDVEALFSATRKLGARERLELERKIVRVGGELQACQRLLGVIDAALAPRAIELSLSDLVRGCWGPKAAFVHRQVELCVRISAGERFLADPQVAWAMVERFLYELPAELTAACAQVDRTPAGAPVLRLGDVVDFSRCSLMRCTFDLGPRLPVESALLDAIVRHFGWNRSKLKDEVQIAFVAA